MRYLTLLLFILCGTAGVAQSYEVSRAQFNGSQDDFCAMRRSDSSLVWVTNRRTDGLGVYMDANDKTTSNLFTLSPGSKVALSLSAAINSISNEGPFCFGPGEKEIFFTGTVQEKGKTPNKLGIFHSRMESGQWTEPVMLPLQTAYGLVHAAHPSLSADGNRLYFSASLPGAIGNSDIYYSDRSGGIWSNPVRLGEPVNTPGNEAFPFIHASGVLYFSTNHHSGGKDYDIFSLDLNDQEASVKRLPEPMNSKRNDYGYWSNARDEAGFISSDREGMRDRVYEFKFVYPVFVDCSESTEMDLCYRISETEIVPVDSLPFRFEWEFGDGTFGRGLSNKHCFPKEGLYHLALNIYDTITNTVFARVSESDLLIEKPLAPYIRQEDRGNGVWDLTGRTEYLEGFVPTDFFWKIGPQRHERGEQVTVQLNSDTVQVNMIVTGVWPDGGSAQYCTFIMLFPEMDVQGPSDVLAASPEEPEEDTPQAGVILPEEQRTYFVEFHVSPDPVPLDSSLFADITYPITERAEDSLTYRYSVGSATNPYELYPVIQDMRDIGFTRSMVREERIVDFNSKVTWSGLIAFGSDEEINDYFEAFSAIRFQTNSGKISPESFGILDLIVDAMEMREDLVIRVTAHTDGDGSAEYNQKLSERRALSVVGYFKKAGIDPTRIAWEGRGESQPVADNSTEQGKGLNRRVEFEVRTVGKK
ncbi:MAG: OmpA family protein [Flavobacteriales bacterium]